MNIIGSLAALPSWSDYYVPEDMSGESPGQGMAVVQTQTSPLTSQDPEGPLAERSKALIEKALQSSAIRALYERACATPSIGGRLGPWQVQFMSFKHGAACFYRNRKIVIDANCSDDDAIHLFVFELTNAVKSGKSIALYEKVRRGQISCEKYVEKKEYSELKGSFLHSEVMKSAITEMGWSKKLDYYSEFHKNLSAEVKTWHGELHGKDWLTKMFARHWLRQKNTTHANVYREQWERMACTNMPMDNRRAKTSARIARAVGRASLFCKCS